MLYMLFKTFTHCNVFNFLQTFLEDHRLGEHILIVRPLGPTDVITIVAILAAVMATAICVTAFIYRRHKKKRKCSQYNLNINFVVWSCLLISQNCRIGQL